MQKSKQAIKSKKKGIAIIIVILVMVMVGLSALTYFGMMREAKNSAYRFYVSEAARQLASSAADEAFMFIYNESKNNKSELYHKLVERSSELDLSDSDLSARANVGLIIPVSLTTSADMAKNLDVKVVARIIDFRNKDSGKNEYYDREGVGTLEIATTVKPKDKNSKYKNSTCTLIRHHDYKCALIVPKTGVSNVSKYVSAYALDYVLFLRDGAKEFETYHGLNLNPGDGIKISIEQEKQADPQKYGKVFLGSMPYKTSNNYSPIFLNIGESNKDLIPTEKEKVLFDVDENTINSILPDYVESLNASVDKYAKDNGADDATAEMHNQFGRFSYEKLPVSDEALVPTLKNYRLLTELVNGMIDNNNSNVISDGDGISILPIEDLDKYILGDVRQRYFHFGRFYVDISEAYADISVNGHKQDPVKMNENQESVNKSAQNYMPVFSPEKWKKYEEKFNLTKKIFDYEPIEDKIKSYPEVECMINTDYPYKKGLTSEDKQRGSEVTQPRFYKHRNSNGSYSDPTCAVAPYSHVNLWARRSMTKKLLAETGIYKDNLLKMHGIVEMSEPLVLGENGDTVFDGCGVIIAPSITIKGGLKPRDENDSDNTNVCILAARGGNIVVDTKEPIEAALIAMASNANYPMIKGAVIANEELNLKGCIVADEMQAYRWKKNASHKITYNPVFKSDEDIYQINVSRWVTFERIIEQEES